MSVERTTTTKHAWVTRIGDRVLWLNRWWSPWMYGGVAVVWLVAGVLDLIRGDVSDGTGRLSVGFLLGTAVADLVVFQRFVVRSFDRMFGGSS